MYLRCLAFEGSLQLPERRFDRRDLPLLQADVARLGAFFETDLCSLDGAIEAEVVASSTKYLYQLAEDACEEGEEGEPAPVTASVKPAQSGWWGRKVDGRGALPRT